MHIPILPIFQIGCIWQEEARRSNILWHFDKVTLGKIDIRSILYPINLNWKATLIISIAWQMVLLWTLLTLRRTSVDVLRSLRNEICWVLLLSTRPFASIGVVHANCKYVNSSTSNLWLDCLHTLKLGGWHSIVCMQISVYREDAQRWQALLGQVADMQADDPLI